MSTPVAEHLPVEGQQKTVGRAPWAPAPVGVAHLVVEGRDEPQLHLQVGATLLGSDELQQVLVLHARRAEDLPLTLPRLLVLRQGRGSAHAAPPAADHHPHPIPTPQLSTCRGGRQKPWTERGPGAEAKNDP